ncbi:hypothetical protein [Henriciella sp.]|uniref:hypothetical protein n=1 Tax=Henriciella sp. TaxID=1968823 RepID=UPI0026213A32|nr:hypothetical protein [Henriciella sp.]
MSNRVAALALAAIPLTAAPAFADAPATTTQTALSGLSLNVADASFYVSVGHDRWRGRNGRTYRTNQWGQSPREVRHLRRDALQRCAGAIQRQGYRAGFRDVDIDDDYRVRQLGPRGFRVRFDDVEFEGRRREFERDVRCTVRRGNVVKLIGLPQPGRRGWNNRRYDHDWKHGRDRDHYRDRDRYDHHDRGHRGRDWSDNKDRGRRTGPGGVRAYGELKGGRPGS